MDINRTFRGPALNGVILRRTLGVMEWWSNGEITISNPPTFQYSRKFILLEATSK
jgi:hypothetical protein